MSVPARDLEYDRFGPWVLEIGDDDPVPPLFADHVSEAPDVLLSIKVPRKVSRRDAVPGMDLYDYVVQLHEETVVIHERVDSTVRSHTIAYREIQHLRISEELLRGRLVLGFPGGAYELPYNTVSSELMRRVAAIIRSRYLAPGETRAHVPTPPDAEKLSFYFERPAQGRDARLTIRPRCCWRSPTSDSARSRPARCAERSSGSWTSDCWSRSTSVTAGSCASSIVAGRLLYRWQTTYGHRETLIPVANITGVTLEPADHATQTLTVSTAAGEPWLAARPRDSRYHGLSGVAGEARR